MIHRGHGCSSRFVERWAEGGDRQSAPGRLMMAGGLRA
ncbi:Hypothetical protein A7982_10703 [Minicystis rosea]|nr:Hypothetical protein A7982_10703 [Minicystis rosea]